jgi:hypothetical protein
MNIHVIEIQKGDERKKKSQKKIEEVVITKLPKFDEEQKSTHFKKFNKPQLEQI